MLLDQGAVVNLQTGSGWAALHWASMTGRDEMTKMLLEEGADVELRDRWGCTALYHAASRYRGDTVETLLEKGADVNAKTDVIIAEGQTDEGWTALHAACTTGSVPVVELLLAHGSDVKVETKNGCTALSLAQERELDEIVKLLRKHEAEEKPAKK